MVTRAVNNPGNFTVGPSDIRVGAYGVTKENANEIGITQGGVGYSYSREYKLFDDSDQHFGAIAMAKTNEAMEVTFAMEENVLENIALAWDIPLANITEGENKITFGGDQLPQYKTIYIDGPAPAGGTASWTLWKAVAMSSAEMRDVKDDNTLIEVTFTVIQDTSKPAGQRFGQRVDVYEDTTAPTITGVVPADDATTVAVGSTVQWTFSEDIQQRDITAGNFNVVDELGNEVAGTLSYALGTYTVEFTPDADLSATTTYFTFVSGEVRDMSGNTLGANNRTSFTTA